VTGISTVAVAAALSRMRVSVVAFKIHLLLLDSKSLFLETLETDTPIPKEEEEAVFLTKPEQIRERFGQSLFLLKLIRDFDINNSNSNEKKKRKKESSESDSN
jgi:hypothetical protein